MCVYGYATLPGNEAIIKTAPPPPEKKQKRLIKNNQYKIIENKNK